MKKNLGIVISILTLCAAQILTVSVRAAVQNPHGTGQMTVNVDSVEARFKEAVAPLYALCGGVTDDEKKICRDKVDSLMTEARTDTTLYKVVTQLAEDYLYDQASPASSVDLYMLFLENMVNHPYPNAMSAIRPRLLLESLLKNRPGSKAADFSFTTRDGRESSLMAELLAIENINGKIMLIFYDPDCDDCREFLTRIEENGKLNSDKHDSIFKIVAIYSGDDREAWEEQASLLPATWTVGYNDGSVFDDEVYFMRATPSVYLIDRDGTVLRRVEGKAAVATDITELFRNFL